MADSAKAAQRAEFRKLVFHVLNEFDSFIEYDVDAAAIERALDNYEPMMNLQRAEDELGPLLSALHSAALRGGFGAISSQANAGRVRIALSVLRGEVKT